MMTETAPLCTSPTMRRRSFLAALVTLPIAAALPTTAPAPATTSTLLRYLADLGGVGVPAHHLPATWQPLAEQAIKRDLLLMAYADDDYGDEYTLTRTGFAAIGRELPGCDLDDAGCCPSCHEHYSGPHHPICPYSPDDYDDD